MTRLFGAALMSNASRPGPLIVRTPSIVLSAPGGMTIAPVVRAIVLNAPPPHPASLGLSLLMSIVSPDPAPATAARRLPVPLSLQLVPAGGAAQAEVADT